MLRGRAFVAHNARFDVSFLTAEFGQLGADVPLNTESCLCTMSLARRYLPSAGRSLVDCCTTLNVALPRHHRAAVDAHAAAELLIGYLTIDPTSPSWTEIMRRFANLAWPSLPINDSPWCCREAAGTAPEHFLARMAARVSAASAPATLRDNDVEYLALLDRVLLDRYVSFPEADALVASADDLGIERSPAELLHRKYLTGLVAAAWTDGVFTEQEREDLNLVASLLAVSDAELTDLIDSGATERQTSESFNSFQLHAGDLVVFTGQMTRDRATWEVEAAAAGLVPWKGITKKVKLLVAADPDSLSPDLAHFS